MTDIDSITSILTEQVAGYRALLDILQRERASLLRFNARTVEALAKEKDTVVLKLRLLEDERIRLVDAFTAQRGIPAGDAFRTLSKLSGGDSLQRLRLQLISLLQSIAELNGFNRVLIERSAAVVKNTLHFLGSSGAAAPAAACGTLLSREA